MYIPQSQQEGERGKWVSKASWPGSRAPSERPGPVRETHVKLERECGQTPRHTEETGEDSHLQAMKRERPWLAHCPDPRILRK